MTNTINLKAKLVQFGTLIKKNLKITFRDKQSLIWLFGYPLLCMAIYSVAFGASGSRASYNIIIINYDVNNSTNPSTDFGANVSLIITDEFRDNENLSESFTLHESWKNGSIYTEDQARILVLEEQIDGVIIIPANFSEVIIGSTSWYSMAQQGYLGDGYESLVNTTFPSGSPGVEIVTTADPITAQIIPSLFDGMVNDILLGMNNISALETTLEIGPKGRSISFFDYSAPGFAILGVLVSISSLASIICTEKFEGMLDRLDTTPVSRPILLGSAGAAQFIFSAIQITVLFGSMFIFGVNMSPNVNWLLAFLLALLFAFVCIGLGLIISSFAKNAQSGGNLAWFFILPMQFLGGTFFAVDADFTKVIPSKYVNQALRQVITYGASWGSIWQDLVILLGFGVVFNLIGILIFMKKKKI